MLGATQGTCVSFYYHMYGTDIHTLTLYTRNSSKVRFYGIFVDNTSKMHNSKLLKLEISLIIPLAVSARLQYGVHIGGIVEKLNSKVIYDWEYLSGKVGNENYQYQT